MLFNLLLALQFVAQGPEEEILAEVPVNWYASTTKLFHFCTNVHFQHPICPQIHAGQVGEFDYESEFFRPPVDGLNYQSLFQAKVLYEVGRPPAYWFVGLNLDGERPPAPEQQRPEEVTEEQWKQLWKRLWAEAQLLWARILFDQRQFEKSLKIFDKLVDDFKGRGLFHQERAWAQFFTGQFERALGSIVSAESPLIHPVPYFERYFLRALIERETCHYEEALKTLATGRKNLEEANPNAKQHPWVVLCHEEDLGTLCPRLETWYQQVYEQKIEQALNDLDLLEIELHDQTETDQEDVTQSPIRWPHVGEWWRDELGYYSVPLEDQC